MTRMLPSSPSSDVDDICVACRAQFHDECSLSFEEHEGEFRCCCGGSVTLREVHMVLTAAEAALAKSIFGDDVPASIGGGKTTDAPALPPAKPKGNSGYIHPDAWPSEKNIGELTDPASTGRHRQAKMYVIGPGQACEWAGLKGHLGGGVEPMIGCVNNPASDLHHGPDKNTLNNEKASLGVGVQENTWIICSECHNTRHALDDKHYPEYDRVADQARPWLPIYPPDYEPVVEEATVEELWNEEERRKADRKRRGRKTRGRNSKPRDPQLEVGDDPDE